MNESDIHRLSRIDRINVIGTSGSGKSTFGRSLADLLGCPFIEMDGLFWGPNWTESPDEEFVRNLEMVTDQPRWVLDGNYTRTTTIKWRQVQLVIWLDMPFVLTLYRVALRSLKRSLNKTEIWLGTGNRETFRKSFLSRDSVILWSIYSYPRNRRRYSKILKSKEYADIWLVHLKSPREVREFLAAAENAANERRADCDSSPEQSSPL